VSSVYLVTFRFRPDTYDEAFHRLNDRVREAAESTPGYRGRDYWEDPSSDACLVVYYWDSLAALGAFAAHPDHREAKRRWEEWYDGYEVTVSEVVDRYGAGLDDASEP
jgi:heme-degrading monooxygenase HmoA